jgi:hypothetical protein
LINLGTTVPVERNAVPYQATNVFLTMGLVESKDDSFDDI